MKKSKRNGLIAFVVLMSLFIIFASTQYGETATDRQEKAFYFIVKKLPEYPDKNISWGCEGIID